MQPELSPKFVRRGTGLVLRDKRGFKLLIDEALTSPKDRRLSEFRRQPHQPIKGLGKVASV